MRIALLAFVFCVGAMHIKAQQSQADSLENELKKHAARDSARINMLFSFCKQTWDIPKLSAAADEAIAIAKELKLPLKEATAYMFKASSFLEEGKDSLYLVYLEKAASLFQQQNDLKGIGMLYKGRGRFYESRSAYYKAIDHYNKAAIQFETINDKSLLGSVSIDIGNCYYNLSDYVRSIEYYLKAQHYYEALHDSAQIAMSIGNIGLVNRSMKKYKTALEQYRSALPIYLSLKDSSGITKLLQSIGVVYDEQSKSDSALWYYNQALGINTRNGFRKSAAENLSNIGITYKDLGNYDSSYRAMNEGLKVYRELNMERNTKVAEINIAELFCTAPASFFNSNSIPVKERYARAISLFKGIVEYAHGAEDMNLESKAWQGLSIAYEKQQEYKNANEALNKFISLRDSLLSEEKIEATTQQADKFEFEKKEALIQATHLLEIDKEKTRRNAIAGGAIILLAGSLVSFLFYKRRRDAIAKQKEAELKIEVTETEMKALRAQMNPHFIFNSLNSISDYIARNDVPMADRYLTKFAKLMRIILENSEQKDVPLSDDLQALELYMQLEALRMNNKFSYEIKIDDDVDKDATMVPPLILQPFVENSIWHGIANQEGLCIISIHIRKEGDDMINCIVEDDGIGRQQSASLKPNGPQQERTSLGMKITQARIDILNKIKNSKAAVELSDLSQGLRVEVKLPLATNF